MTRHVYHSVYRLCTRFSVYVSTPTSTSLSATFVVAACWNSVLFRLVVGLFGIASSFLLLFSSLAVSHPLSLSLCLWHSFPNFASSALFYDLLMECWVVPALLGRPPASSSACERSILSFLCSV